MKFLEDRTDRLRLQAEQVMAVVTEQDRVSWLQHPCTRALRSRLEADLSDLFMEWVSGSSTTSAIEANALLNTRLLTKAQDLELFIESINEVGESGATEDK